MIARPGTGPESPRGPAAGWGGATSASRWRPGLSALLSLRRAGPSAHTSARCRSGLVHCTAARAHGRLPAAERLRPEPAPHHQRRVAERGGGSPERAPRGTSPGVGPDSGAGQSDHIHKDERRMLILTLTTMVKMPRTPDRDARGATMRWARPRAGTCGPCLTKPHALCRGRLVAPARA